VDWLEKANEPEADSIQESYLHVLEKLKEPGYFTFALKMPILSAYLNAK